MSRQMLGYVREPTEAKPGTPRRHDHHYERNGTVNLFTFFEPLANHRVVFTRDRRTKTDWAECVREVLDTCYPEAEKVVLVTGNLNTHGFSSLYEAFKPAEVRRLAKRLEIPCTPEHGSWLNVAEIEQSVLAKQAPSRRIPDRGQSNRERRSGKSSATRQTPLSTGSLRPKMLELSSNGSTQRLTIDEVLACGPGKTYKANVKGARSSILR